MKKDLLLDGREKYIKKAKKILKSYKKEVNNYNCEYN